MTENPSWSDILGNYLSATALLRCAPNTTDPDILGDWLKEQAKQLYENDGDLRVVRVRFPAWLSPLMEQDDIDWAEMAVDLICDAMQLCARTGNLCASCANQQQEGDPGGRFPGLQSGPHEPTETKCAADMDMQDARETGACDQWGLRRDDIPF